MEGLKKFKKFDAVCIFRISILKNSNNILNEAKMFCPDNHLMEVEKDLKAIKIVPTEIVYLDALEEGGRIKQVLKDNEVTLKPGELLLAY